jgi:hypothetical protein
MKITAKQRNAASAYWTQIFTGELNARALIASNQEKEPFIAAIESMTREGYLERLNEENPTWPSRFMNNLDSLLIDADDDLCLRLEFVPESLLKRAAEMTGIPKELFPMGILSMTFDNKGNIVIGGEEVNADSFLRGIIDKGHVVSSFRTNRGTLFLPSEKYPTQQAKQAENASKCCCVLQ